jgi:hypothetical protein
MNIFLRTFNNKINSKTGAPLPEGKYRGTPEWMEFQKLLIECLEELGHNTMSFPEQGPYDILIPECDRKIAVHLSRREHPEYDLFWMQMHMADLFTIDTNGWGFDHSGLKDCTSYLEDKEDSTRFCQDLSDKLHASGSSKCEQPTVTDPTPEKFILVPVQTPRDYVLTHHSPITVKYFIESIVNWASENQYHVCFKMHPHNKSDHNLLDAVNYGVTNSRYVHKVEGNIHELIKRSVGLFVINSGTGFEALLHGKPVATFGAADYNRVTFNADIRRLDEARNFLFGWTGEQRVIAYQFCYWYYMRHAYCLSLPNTKERLKSYLMEKLA